MKVRDILTQAFQRIGYDDTEARGLEWFNNVLDNLETKGAWKFLRGTTTHQTENAADNILFSASKWPAAALTNYSKEMTISTSAGPRKSLKKVSNMEMQALRAEGTTGYPEYFNIYNDTLNLFPQNITDFLPLLTLYFLTEFTRATAQEDDLETDLSIPLRYHQYFITGVLWQVMADTRDEREKDYKERWDQNVLIMTADNEKVD